MWFPTILNSLANHDGVETRICDILDAGARSASNATEVMLENKMKRLTVGNHEMNKSLLTLDTKKITKDDMLLLLNLYFFKFSFIDDLIEI